MAMKINRLEIENVKRVKAVKLEPSQNGLTIIGGNNNQGKTSILDAIAWALGGDKYRPSKAQREQSVIPPESTYCNEQWPCGGTERQKQFIKGNGSGWEKGRAAALK